MSLYHGSHEHFYMPVVAARVQRGQKLCWGQYSDGVDVQEGRAATPAEATLLSTSEALTPKEVLRGVPPSKPLDILRFLVCLLGLETAMSLPVRGKLWLYGNERCFWNCTGSKRRAKENAGPLLGAVGDLMTKGTQISEVLNAFLISVFMGKGCLLDSLRSPGLLRRVCESETLPTIEEDQIRPH